LKGRSDERLFSFVCFQDDEVRGVGLATKVGIKKAVLDWNGARLIF